MNGKSHVIVNFTAAIVCNSAFHVADKPVMWKSIMHLAVNSFNWTSIVYALRDPFLLSAAVSSFSFIHRVIFYGLMLFGALLPDIDQPNSTLGRKFKLLSNFFHQRFGHRTFTHSFFGFLFFFAFWMAIGLGTLKLLAMHSIVVPTPIESDLWLSLVAVMIGCSIHVFADSLTRAGVPVFWPADKTSYGIPFVPEWRFLVGSWTEFIVVFLFVFAVGIGVGISLFGF